MIGGKNNSPANVPSLIFREENKRMVYAYVYGIFTRDKEIQQNIFFFYKHKCYVFNSIITMLTEFTNVIIKRYYKTLGCVSE